jgi:uncharacterized protein YndB with AHSA1/START domain
MEKGLIARATMTINSPRIKVWNALVNPESIKKYMFGPMSFLPGMKGVLLFGGENGTVHRTKTKV